MDEGLCSDYQQIVCRPESRGHLYNIHELELFLPHFYDIFMCELVPFNVNDARRPPPLAAAHLIKRS